MVCINTAASGAHFISIRRIAPTSLAEYFRLTVGEVGGEKNGEMSHKRWARKGLINGEVREGE